MNPITGLEHLRSLEQQALLEFTQALQSQFQDLLHSVVLFGSKARGDDAPTSDLDLLIVVDSADWQLHKQIRYLAADVSFKYSLDLSPRVWSLAHLKEMQEMAASLYRNIQRDGIDLLPRPSSICLGAGSAT